MFLIAILKARRLTRAITALPTRVERVDVVVADVVEGGGGAVIT